jgi:small-conductance mechanosensitive channel
MSAAPASAEPAGPLFDPIVSGDALADEASRFMQQLETLRPEEIAVRGGWTLAIIVGALALLWVLRFALRFSARLLSPRQEKDGERGKAARRNVGSWTMLVARFAVTLIAIGWILYVWGFDVRAGALGQVLGVIWRVGFIIVFATAISEVVAFAISRLLQRSAHQSDDLRRAAQMRTLAPVLTGVMHTLIGIIALMMVMSEIGLDVGPMIAGAGILGIAIGFGAQSLVKDFLTGVFFIVEDIVSVGDIVRIGNASGLVEAMTLRTIRLRDFDGTLHIFPYGEAQVVHNKTKTFSFYVFDLSVAYSADIGKALQLMNEIGEQMRHEPPYDDAIIEPIEVVGVDGLADSGVRLKARIKTKPAKQWAVGREYLKRIKFAFDANGIEIPFPHIKLVPPDPIVRPGDRPQAAE